MECIHHWKLSNPYRDNGHRITHHRCLRCGGEKDLVEKLVDLKKYVSIIEDKRLHEVLSAEYTDIIYPEKGGDMKEKRTKAYFLENKEAILADWEKLGDAGLCRKWGFASATWTGKKRQWGLLPPKETRNKPAEILQHDTKCKCVNGGVPIEVVEKMINYRDVDLANAYWEGYKEGRGLCH